MQVLQKPNWGLFPTINRMSTGSMAQLPKKERNEYKGRLFYFRTAFRKNPAFCEDFHGNLAKFSPAKRGRCNRRDF
jgi:hypothetical protein